MSIDLRRRSPWRSGRATGGAGHGHRRPPRRRQAARTTRHRAARLARPPRARSCRTSRCARRARSRAIRCPPLRARRRDDARGPGRHADRPGVRRELGASSTDVDLRRRRLHGRAGQGRQGARLPGDGVRRPRDLRHPPPVPDGRRGASHLADADVRANAAHELGGRDAVCILTHDPKFDVPAVQGALATKVGYIGVMGSRTTHAKRMRAPGRGGGHRSGRDRPADVTDRARPRCTHAGGDSDLDLCRDHRPSHRARSPRHSETAAARSTSGRQRLDA